MFHIERFYFRGGIEIFTFRQTVSHISNEPALYSEWCLGYNPSRNRKVVHRSCHPDVSMGHVNSFDGVCKGGYYDLKGPIPTRSFGSIAEA